MTPTAPSLLRLFVIGDSIASGYFPFLAQALEGTFICSRKGNRETETKESAGPAVALKALDSDEILDYLQTRRATIPLRADVVLLNCGLHDLITFRKDNAKKVPPERYEQNLRAIIAEVRSLPARLIWVRTTPILDEEPGKRPAQRFAADVAPYNQIADAVMEEASVPVIDLHGFSLKLLPHGLMDLVHFNEEACALQGRFMADFLRAAQE